MEKSTRIYIAGHRGLAGGAILRELQRQGFTHLINRTHAELDLEDAMATRHLFEAERPQVVFLAAAKVGGILANNAYPADFLMTNLQVEASVFRAAHLAGTERLIFLGSSCIDPRDAVQPIREDSLLTGPLEATNRPYAIAKIAGIEMCWSYNRQFGHKWLAAMPTNLYGPGDNYDLQTSHVLPALIRKAHEAKVAGARELALWGTGTPRREFRFADDLARALVFLATLDDARYDPLVAPDHCPLLNVGSGEDLSIAELVECVARVVGFTGCFLHDTTKPGGTPRTIMDVSRIKASGWRPQVDLPSGIALACRDFLDGRHD